jgi:4-hydroxyphenylpyruvate dioxygenase-like putative hemolysin
MERAGEGIYSVTFKTKDLKRAIEHLRSKGQRVTDDEGSIVIDREDAFGMVLGFTERTIPNDPR